MEYSPPPLFKQGAPARVKVTVFACISVALLFLVGMLFVIDKQDRSVAWTRVKACLGQLA